MSLVDEVFRDRLVLIASRCPNVLVRQVRALGARDVLHAGRRDPGLEGCHFLKLRTSSRVAANNCTTAVLYGSSASALRSRRFFESFHYVCLPFGTGWLFGLPGFLRYGLRGRLRRAGWVRLDGSLLPVPVFRNTAMRRHARIYGPDRWSSKKILQAIADLDCVLLRWPEAVEDGFHRGDLDLLATSAAADAIEARLSAEAGTAPIDLYSDDGSGGRSFKSVPYFPPAVARKIIASASLRPSGIKLPSPEGQYLAFCFHLLFHKSSALEPGEEELRLGSFGDPKYLAELERLAGEAGCAAPRSISEIEAALKEYDAFPEIDTVGFFSEKNRFLQHRFRDAGRNPPGLAVFVVRDFGLGAQLVGDVRDEIVSSGFRILQEIPLDPERDREVAERIRGGNWVDPAAGGSALPIHAFICHDPKPLRPSASVRRRYPRLDNERTLLKTRVRGAAARARGLRKLNVVHASDNSSEAVSYIRALGVEPAAE